MPVIIRLATQDDAAQIAAVHVASWRVAFRNILPDDYLDGLSPADRLPMWTRVLGDGANFRVIVAENDGAIAGFASVGLSEEAVPGEMTLYTLYLHPDATGKGIGRALLAVAERLLTQEGASAATLRVITANLRARHGYERSGWVAEPDTVRVEDAWGTQVETIGYSKSMGRCHAGTRNEQGCVETDDPRG